MDVYMKIYTSKFTPSTRDALRVFLAYFIFVHVLYIVAFGPSEIQVAHS
jgi:hypothetical protein